MYSQGMFSIGGIASGLDTDSIVTQLMQLERQPVVRMQNTQRQLEQVDDAWGKVNTKLSALRTAVDAISKPAQFSKLVAVNSSNTDAVGVAASGSAGSGSVSFHVTQLAQSHQLASANFTSADQVLGVGTFEVTTGGTTTSIDLDADDTVTDLATKLNAAKGGFTASVVKVADGQHRVMLTSNTTGSQNGLSIESALTEFATPTNLREALDAKVQLGTGAGAIEITRSSNTISDLMDGATITLKQTTTDPVTVTASRDVDGAVKAVKSYVDALNGAISTLADLSGYDADTERGGVLQGDSTARSLLSRLRSAVTAPTAVASGFTSGYQVGLSIDRDGAVTLDETKLKAALNEDFDAVARLFSTNGTSTASAPTSVTGTSQATPGTYEVQVTTAAKVARATGALVAPTDDAQPKTFRVVSGTKSATVTLDSTMTSSSAIVAAIQEALEAAEIADVTAQVDGAGQVELASTDYGTAAEFTVESVDGYDVGLLAGTHNGSDVEGGWRADSGDAFTPMTGTGQLLTGTGDAEGLLVTFRGEAAATFEVTYSRGLAGNMSDTLEQAEGSAGMVARARQGITSQIDLYQDRIDSFDIRLQTREATLRRQFTAMEVAMAEMQSQGNWLASQLGSLAGLNAQQ